MTKPPSTSNGFNIDAMGLDPQGAQKYNRVFYLNPYDPSSMPRSVQCWATEGQKVKDANGREKRCTKISVLIECISEEDAEIVIKAVLEQHGRGFKVDMAMKDPNTFGCWDDVKEEVNEVSRKAADEGLEFATSMASSCLFCCDGVL